MGNTVEVLRWQVRHDDSHVLAHFVIADAGGLLRESELPSILLPTETRGHEPLGLILSGKGPVWLYAYLAHLAHAFAWLAVYDPRLAGAVVVSRHRPDAPAVGAVVTCTPLATPA